MKIQYKMIQLKKKLFSNIIMKKYDDKKFYSNYTH